jgi:excisionase family DNA binding protein
MNRFRSASPPKEAETKPAMLKVSDVAAQLNVCDRTVRRWIEAKQLKEHRFGRSIRISAADLQRFLNANR